MAATRRRRRRQKKSKLVLLLLPIALLLAILIWLFLDEGKRLLGPGPISEIPGRQEPSKQPSPQSTERILDRERKKLDEILENR